MNDVAPFKKVKIDIITGFLGAGKTTFIIELLKQNPKERIVICENEFGKASIDAALLRGYHFDVFELREGCICCTLAVELVAGLKSVIETLKPDRIIIEPTGLARLNDILNALESKDICRLVEIDMKAVILDGSRLQKFFAQYLHHFGDQLKFANAVFVSKTEAYTDAQRVDALAALSAAYPELKAILLPLLPNDGNLWDKAHSKNGAPDSLRSEAVGFARASDGTGSPTESTAGYTALSFPTSYKGSKERFEALLQNKGHWGEIVRAKGTVYDNDMRCYRLDYAAELLTSEPTENPGIDEVQLIGIGLNAVALRSKLGVLGKKK